MSLFPDWQETQKNNSIYPRRLQVMYNAYGVSDGNICGNCDHLIVKHYSRKYFKCGLSHQSNSVATDWRKKWPACGRFKLTANS